jgi:hypothetical protein
VQLRPPPARGSPLPRTPHPNRNRQVVADLEQPGLAAALGAAGHDAGRPTVWVAEGLCYYLSLGANAALLADAGRRSAPRSAWVATHIPACNLEANRAAPASNGLARLFTVAGPDVAAAGAYAAGGWGGVEASGDIAELVAARCGGAHCYYPYPLTYSGGAPLPEIEHVVTAARLV